MSKNTVNNVCKWASVLFVVLALFMLFRGYMGLADSDEKEDTIESMSYAYEGLDDMDSDEIEDMQDTFDDYDIDINIKSFLRKFKKLLKTLSDGEISPYEIATAGPDLLKVTSYFREYDELGYFFGRYEEAFEIVDNIKAGIIMFVILFIISVLCAVVIIIMHIADLKPAGISLVILNIIWLIIFAVVTSRINDWAEMEMDYDDKYMKMSAAPVLALLFAVIAMVIWLYKDKIIENSAGFVQAPVVQSAAIQTPGDGRICPNCGKALNPGAVFCSGCGTKYVEPAAAEPAVQEKAFCPNCGVQISIDSEFCPNCGNKIE